MEFIGKSTRPGINYLGRVLQIESIVHLYLYISSNHFFFAHLCIQYYYLLKMIYMQLYNLERSSVIIILIWFMQLFVHKNNHFSTHLRDYKYPYLLLIIYIQLNMFQVTISIE